MIKGTSGLRRASMAASSLASITALVHHQRGLVGALLLVVAVLVLHQGSRRRRSPRRPVTRRATLDVAVAVVGIGHERQAGRRRDIAQALDHIGQADQPDIRIGVARRQHGRTAHGEGMEAGLLDQPCRQRIVGQRGDQRRFALERVASRMRS